MTMTFTLNSLPEQPKSAPLTIARLAGARRMAVWGIALLFTLFIVQWSERNGRLAQDVTYDDVGYFNDGVEKQRAFDRNGVAGLTTVLVHNPPHSTFSTALAMASFEFLGVNDWAPYVFNVFVLAAYLFFCSRSFGDLPSTAFYCLLIFCLTIPFALFAIHDFRPDFAGALATTAFVWFGLAAALGAEEEARANTIWAGILLGAALWIKPSVFAYTLVMALLVGAAIAASGWLPGWQKRRFKDSLLLGLTFGVVGVVVAAPYYVVNGRQTFDYFITNTRGANADTYTIHAPLLEILRTFTVDGNPALLIGRYLWLLLACAAAGLVWAFRSRHFRICLQIAGLLAAAAVSLAIFVYGRQNSMYLAFFYQIPVLAAALAALSPIIRASRRASLIAPVLLLLALTPFFLTPRARYWTPAPEANPDHGWNRKLVSAIVADSGYQPSEDTDIKLPVPVFVTFAGSVGSESMKWIAVKEQLPFVFSDLLLSGEVSKQLSAAGQSAYVVVSTPTAQSVYTQLPSSETFARVLAQLRGDPNFREVKVTTEAEPPYRLFRNLATAVQFNSGSTLLIGWPTTGFKDIEGPYPQWELPKVRWGTFPRSTVTVTMPQTAAGLLRFTATAPAGATVQIKVNGEAVGQHVQQVGRPETAEVPLLLHTGENVISLDYRFPDGPQPPGTLAFLYRSFELDTQR